MKKSLVLSLLLISGNCFSTGIPIENNDEYCLNVVDNPSDYAKVEFLFCNNMINPPETDENIKVVNPLFIETNEIPELMGYNFGTGIQGNNQFETAMQRRCFYLAGHGTSNEIDEKLWNGFCTKFFNYYKI